MSCYRTACTRQKTNFSCPKKDAVHSTQIFVILFAVHSEAIFRYPEKGYYRSQATLPSFFFHLKVGDVENSIDGNDVVLCESVLFQQHGCPGGEPLFSLEPVLGHVQSLGSTLERLAVDEQETLRAQTNSICIQ